MNTVSILIIVDTVGAMASGSLQSNVYVVDSNKYLGSWGEGANTLHTVCSDGQTLSWAVCPVNPGNDVQITGFSGTMVSGGTCAPSKQGIAGDISWQGRVETRGAVGQYSYTVGVDIAGKAMSFSPSIKVV
jgi:hypothetical protein